ncbi:Ras guanine nucleotide exchange factor bud5 [Malassezia yamatoensis]|uniref:Ras guanine nucleotide exchange factor bud5 n=1 Tax=Malassezia yamatoensis TaxID=253288 RepID=A0AAJ6CIN1_9BASI|nr:Ras guanine nucleotide exchange factor bud5 [Malassezia yamatoensis]
MPGVLQGGESTGSQQEESSWVSSDFSKTETQRANLCVDMVAVHDFDPSVSSGCVRLTAGQVVKLYSKDASGWSDVATSTKRGWVPTSFLVDRQDWIARKCSGSRPFMPCIQDADLNLNLSRNSHRQEPSSSGNARNEALPDLYIPEGVPMIASCIAAAHAFYAALQTRESIQEAAQKFVTSIESLLYLPSPPTRHPHVPYNAMRDALARQLEDVQSLLTAHLSIQSKQHESNSSCSLECNSANCGSAQVVFAVNRTLLACAEIVDTVNPKTCVSHRRYLMDSEPTCSQTSSLLDEMSLNDSCSSMRNSDESNRSWNQRDELKQTLSHPSSMPLSKNRNESCSDWIAEIQLGYERVASTTAAFFGQLHTFDEWSVPFAFQSVMQLGFALDKDVLHLYNIIGTILQSSVEHLNPMALFQRCNAAQTQLGDAHTAYRDLMMVCSKKQRPTTYETVSLCTSDVLKTTNSLLRSAARASQYITCLIQTQDRALAPVAEHSNERHSAASMPRDTIARPASTSTSKLKFQQCTNPSDCDALHELACWNEQLDEVSCDRPSSNDASAASNLIRNAQGKVLGGTLAGLVQWFCQDNTELSSGSGGALLSNFRAYAHGEDLLQSLLLVYDCTASTTNARAQVVKWIINWLEVHWLASDDCCVLVKLRAWLTHAHEPGLHSAFRRLAELIEWRLRLGDGLQKIHLQVTNDPHGLCQVRRVLSTADHHRYALDLCGNEENLYRQNSSGIPRMVDTDGLYSASKALIPGTAMPPAPLVNMSLLHNLRKAPTIWHVSLLEIDALELARQITIFEARLFASILPNELLYSHTPYKRSNNQLGCASAIHTRAMSTFTTQLTNWIGECILRETQVKKRSWCLQYFVRLGAASLSLNNFNLLMAVQGAMNSSTILRLKHTWASLPRKIRDNFEEQRCLMESTRNFSAYRAKLRGIQGAAIPFLGLINTDLTFCMSGNALWRAGPNGQVINLVRCFKLAAILAEVQRFQRQPYALIEVPELQRYLAQIRQEVHVGASVESCAAAADRLYERSLQLEPREEHSFAKPGRGWRQRATGLGW